MIGGRMRKDFHPFSSQGRLVMTIRDERADSEHQKIRSAFATVASRLCFRENQSRIVLRDKRRRPAQARPSRKTNGSHQRKNKKR